MRVALAMCGWRMADRTEIDPAIYRPIAKSKWSGRKGTHPPGRRRHRLARYYSPLHSIHSSQSESQQPLHYPSPDSHSLSIPQACQHPHHLVVLPRLCLRARVTLSVHPSSRRRDRRRVKMVLAATLGPSE